MEQQKEIEALRALIALLWKQVEEATVVAETLRELLQQHGVLSSGEIETKLAEGRQIQTVAMLKALEKGVEVSWQDALRRFLEGFDGPKQ